MATVDPGLQRWVDEALDLGFGCFGDGGHRQAQAGSAPEAHPSQFLAPFDSGPFGMRRGAEGAAELVITPTPPQARGSVADAFGTAPVLRTGDDILAQVRAERDEWGEDTVNPRVMQIPLPGGSGNAPTGAVQFQDDWPGLFLRGDTAIVLGLAIRNLERALAGSDDVVVASALSKLSAIAGIIERDVRVK